MDEAVSYLGENLRFLIPASGMGFRQFARETNIHYSLLKRYMAGEVSPKPAKIRMLADLLDVKPGALIYQQLVPLVAEL